MSMARVGLGGALGGGVNAWLCYSGVPVRISNANFEWHVIPCGAALNRSVFAEDWPESLTWPFETEWAQALWAPFAYLGLVALLYYCWLVTRGLNASSRADSIAAASASGVLGSLWWWALWEHR